jgi:two-component system KDP operon response regulator KdpE
VATILIADDDPSALEVVSMLLTASGYQVEQATSAAEALNSWPRSHPDLVIMDFHMPGGGVELIRSIAGSTSVPLLVLSADHRDEVKVEALDAGAEDYVTKPFSASELLARIRVQLRRQTPEAGILKIGDLELDEADRTVRLGAGSVVLTPTEFDLLKALSGGDFVATTSLLHEIWGPAYQTEQEYVRVYIRRLRAKLGSLGLDESIDSRPGLGYRLCVGA